MARNFNQQNRGGGYQGSANRGRYDNRAQAVQLPDIVLDYKVDPELFNETAKKIAVAIDGTKPTQIRNFYDYLLDLYDRSKREDFVNILPFVKMMNSKANYAKERRVASVEFVAMIEKCVAGVKTKEQLEIFKLFFEAVIGFCKK